MNKSSVFYDIRDSMIYVFMTVMDVMRITIFKRKFLHVPFIR